MHFIRTILHNIKYRLILHSILHNFILHFYANSVYQDKKGPIKYIEHTIKGSPRLHKSRIKCAFYFKPTFLRRSCRMKTLNPHPPPHRHLFNPLEMEKM